MSARPSEVVKVTVDLIVNLEIFNKKKKKKNEEKRSSEALLQKNKEKKFREARRKSKIEHIRPNTYSSQALTNCLL